jgi:hypothetical protein
MFRSSWDHHEAVLCNTTKLIELSIWIHILVQRVHIVKVIKVVESNKCVMRITILKYQKVYKNFIKNFGGDVKWKVINMLKDIIY